MFRLNAERAIPFYTRMNVTSSPADDGKKFWVFWQRSAPAQERFWFPRTERVHLEVGAKSHFVLQALAKAETVSPSVIAREYSARHSERLLAEEVTDIVVSLYRYGFLVPTREAERLGFKEISPRGDLQSLSDWRPLRVFQLPLFNPDRLLEWVDTRFGGLLFSRALNAFVMSCIALVIVAVLSSSERMWSEWTILYQEYLPEHFALLTACLLCGKLIHELAHGLAIKHFGREVPEIGIRVMFFTLFPYCESQCARGLSKRSEMIIAGAGVYAEVAIAAVFGALWLSTEFDESRYLYLAMMLSFGVNTVLFNGNPISIFDSYHVLSHATGYSEHLREYALEALDYRLQRFFFGIEPSYVSTDARRSLFLPCFGLAVLCYRTVLAFGITAFLFHMFEPYGLGALLGAVASYKLIILPGIRVLKWFVSGMLRMWGVKATQITPSAPADDVDTFAFG